MATTLSTADDPCQGDLGRCCTVCLGQRAQRVQQLVTSGEVLVEEQRVGEANAAGPMVGVVLGGEEPLGERAVGDDQPVIGGGERHEILIRAALGEAVLDLVAHDGRTERAVQLASIDRGSSC